MILLAIVVLGTAVATHALAAERGGASPDTVSDTLPGTTAAFAAANIDARTTG
jgi:hypothetical protein